MSGISILRSMDGRAVPEELARCQLAAIAHRGDTSGAWTGRGVALAGQHRARTPQAEREAVPFIDGEQGVSLVWDGRLDNRDELMRRLGLASSAGDDPTDAALIAEAYARWGEDFPRHLLGDWAIALWDDRRRRLLCAKDPVGWRPLFYAQRRGLLAVGSEPEQLFAGGWVSPIVNHDYLLRYIADAAQPRGSTCFEGLFELDGGQLLVATDRSVQTRTLWDGPRASSRPYKRPEEYAEEFRELFARAVRDRLRSNRRVGVFLSGGLDSSHVAAIAAQECDRVMAITSHAPDTRWDERDHQQTVLEQLNIDHVAVDVSSSWALDPRVLPTAACDAPSFMPQHALWVDLAEAAEDAGVGVTFGGEGSDEWMTGDHTFVADALARGRLRTAWQLARRAPHRGSTARALLRHAYRGFISEQGRRALRLARQRPSYAGYSPLLESCHWPEAGLEFSTPVWRRRSRLRNSWRYYRHYSSGDQGWRDRRVFQRYGIDHRSPFNDLRIIELMASTPEWMKRFRGRTKEILRHVEYDSLPASIVDRPDKAVYDEPYDIGLRTRERRRAEAALEAAIRVPGVRADAALAEARGWLDGEHERWAPTWRLVSAGLWLRHLDALRSAPADGITPLGATSGGVGPFGAAPERSIDEEGVHTSRSNHARRHP